MTLAAPARWPHRHATDHEARAARTHGASHHQHRPGERVHLRRILDRALAVPDTSRILRALTLRERGDPRAAARLEPAYLTGAAHGVPSPRRIASALGAYAAHHHRDPGVLAAFTATPTP